jgi:hydroxypyruvate isomerase
MLELSACIEWLFGEEAKFADRIVKAEKAGLGYVEFWTWRDKNLPEISAALEQTGVHVTSFLSEPEGRLVDPMTHDAFLAGVAESARAAQSLDCRGLIVLAGDTLSGVSRQSQRVAIVEALQNAAPIAARHDVTLLLEPLNTRVDHIGYFLDSTVEGLEIIEDVSTPNVKLLFDLYHSTVMGEKAEDVLRDRMDLVGHIHLADAPGRHEPGTGTIDWPATLSWLSTSGYRGRLGLEYMPSRGTSDSFSSVGMLLSRTDGEVSS